MIVLNLECRDGHGFEGWFASSQAFEEQIARNLVECPVCGIGHVTRRPSAPYVLTRSSAPSSDPASQPKTEASPARLISQLRQAAASAEDVGARFPEEARRMHYGDIEARGIKGQASGEDVRDLLEEGIAILPVPPADEDLH